MSRSFVSTRLLTGAVVVLLLSTTSGCSWVKKKFTTEAPYQESQLSRPLEAPPGLDLPRDVSGLAIPAAASNGSVGTAPPATSAATASDAFMLADSVDSAFRRIGIALERIDGVTVTSKAALLNSYEVSYSGATMLIHAEAMGDKARVSALGTDGKALSGGASADLLGLLKSRLN